MQQRLLAIFAALSPPWPSSPAAPTSEDSSKQLPDAATLLKESSETTKAQTSVHLQLTVQGEIKELPIESLEGDLTNAPAVAAQGKANLIFLGQKLDDVDFVVADGNLFARSPRRRLPELRAGRRHLRRFGHPEPATPGWPTFWPTSPTPRPTAARPSTASTPSG